MPRDAGNINILHPRSVRKTRTETTQQIAVPHGIPSISGQRQPPSDIFMFIELYRVHRYLQIIGKKAPPFVTYKQTADPPMPATS